MPIEFVCTNCNSPVRTPDATAGKKGRCPSCKAVIQIPEAAPATAAKAVDDGVIAFHCGKCNHVVRAPKQHAGKKGKCPKCQSVVDIPTKSTLPAAAKPQRKPATSLGGGLTSLDEPQGNLSGGLTQVDEPTNDPLGSLSALEMAAGPALPGSLGAPVAGGGFGFGAPTPVPTWSAKTIQPTSHTRSVTDARQMSSGEARAWLMFPAIVMVITSSLSTLMFLFVGIIGVGIQVTDPRGGDLSTGELAFLVVAVLLGIVFNVVIMAGAINMMKLKGYGLAVCAAILAMVPCPPCWVSLFFGI